LPDYQISAVENLVHDVRSASEIEINQVRLAILDFIKRWRLLRVGLNVRELVIVKDGCDVKRLLIPLEAVGELHLRWIVAAKVAHLTFESCLGSLLRVTRLRPRHLCLLPEVLDLLRRDKAWRAVQGRNHRFI